METVGVALRAVATIIDMIVLGVVAWVVALFTGGTTATGFELQGAPAFLMFLLALGYYVAMEARLGWTLGKRAIGLKVVKLDGSALDWQASIIRNLLRVVDGLFFYLVGAIMVWTSKQRQRLGDRAAATLVVRGR